MTPIDFIQITGFSKPLYSMLLRDNAGRTKETSKMVDGKISV